MHSPTPPKTPLRGLVNIPPLAGGSYNVEVMTRAEIKKLAMALPAEERLVLSEALRESAYSPLTKAQKRELDRRWEEYLANPDDTIPAEQVFAEITDQLSE